VNSPRRLKVSTENAAFQVLESLSRNRTARHRAGAFLVEGVLPITRALDHAWTIDAVVQIAGATLSGWAADVIRRAAPQRRYELTPALMARLCGRADGSELLAVVRMADPDIARVPIGHDLLALVLDRPGNPGNLGTIVRSCDALGADGVIVTGHAVDIYDPAVITASRGSLFAVPVVPVASHAEVIGWRDAVRARLGRCLLVGADERGAEEIAGHDFTAPTIVVLGNETAGLSRAYRDACDARVRIPMHGAASSLNVAVAASVMLYEAARQRRAAGASPRSLAPPGQ
jgi:tRNA G18 (ribose-2'-O)-methylase SpoU